MQESKTALPNGREDVVYDADSRNDVNCFDSQLSRQITCDAYFNRLFAASKRMDTSLKIFPPVLAGCPNFDFTLRRFCYPKMVLS